MPSFKEYKDIARERGALAYEVFVVISRPQTSPEAFSKHLPAHLAYLAEQEKAGTLMFAGPWSDEAGENMSGIGFLVWRAKTWDEAKALADGDPMHATGAKTYEMRRWLINEGNLSLSIGLGAKSFSLE